MGNESHTIHPKLGTSACGALPTRQHASLLVIGLRASCTGSEPNGSCGILQTPEHECGLVSIIATIFLMSSDILLSEELRSSGSPNLLPL